ncbi:hypothetical protein BS50DRAFT_570193 [Corynespora cassiicola Philippines]|uniref:C2H2-type domain-containing protein n=1 Tax=Corynespora cassiicola Philippines TaxID=1448308 RepID=A0A2T2NZ15_CORCC|nr:hypothetical protein BS50DRAFT_570193 [Corynespora cassiicola Philippines]
MSAPTSSPKSNLVPIFADHANAIEPQLALSYGQNGGVNHWQSQQATSMEPRGVVSSHDTGNITSSAAPTPLYPTLRSSSAGPLPDQWFLPQTSDENFSPDGWIMGGPTYHSPVSSDMCIPSPHTPVYFKPEPSDECWGSTMAGPGSSPYYSTTVKPELALLSQEWEDGSSTPSSIASGVLDPGSPASSFSELSGGEDLTLGISSPEFFDAQALHEYPYTRYQAPMLGSSTYPRVRISRHPRRRYNTRLHQIAGHIGHRIPLEHHFPLEHLQRTDRKEYHCDFVSPDTGARCERSFGRPEHLKRHLKTHSGEKPFECLICDRPFNRRDNCHDHYWTHVERPGKTGRNGRMSIAGIAEKTKDPRLVEWLEKKMAERKK